MKQMIASWSTVMVHGLMVWSYSLVPRFDEIVGLSWRARIGIRAVDRRGPETADARSCGGTASGTRSPPRTEPALLERTYTRHKTRP